MVLLKIAIRGKRFSTLLEYVLGSSVGEGQHLVNKTLKSEDFKHYVPTPTLTRDLILRSNPNDLLDYDCVLHIVNFAILYTKHFAME
jgi:hypothetical protein